LIDKFVDGPPETVRRLNLIVEACNAFKNLQGDDLIRAFHTSFGATLRLNIDEVYRRMPKYNDGGGDGAPVSIAEVTEAITHGSSSSSVSEYTIQKIDSTGTKDGTNILIDRAMGYEGYGTDGEDIRNFIPWFGIGARVPIIQHYDIGGASGAGGLKWFFYIPQTFIGKPTDRSLDVEVITTANESEYRAMAVYK